MNYSSKNKNWFFVEQKGKKMSDKIKIGLVGYGNMGIAHADNIKTLAEIELTGVADSSPERLKIASKNLGPDVKMFEGLSGFAR